MRKYISFVLLFFILLSLSCLKRDNQKSGSSQYINPLDSIRVVVYSKTSTSDSSKFRSTSNQYIVYYQLIKGVENDYFYFIYDEHEDVGKRYRFAYHVTTDNKSELYEVIRGTNNTSCLNKDQAFTISIKNEEYLIEKYKSPPTEFRSETYHYLNKEVGLIAIECNGSVDLIEYNSRIEDKLYIEIKNKLIEKMQNIE